MRSGWKAVLAAFVAISVAACGGGGGGSSSVNDPQIRYVNASPDVSPLTFSLDGEDKATSIAYLGLSSGFQEEDSGSYDVAVREDGANPELDAIAAAFQNDTEYLIASVGLENFGTEFIKRLRLVSIPIEITAPNGNRSRIYVLHAFNRAVGLDTPPIDLRNPGENPQYRVENISFGTVKSLEIDSSTQTFVARRTDSESVYATNTGTFDAGGIYLAIVAGIENEVGALEPVIQFIKLN